MTPQNLKQRLVDIIGALIGRYYPANIPSIYIGQPPAEFTVKGLEVYIPSLPQQSRSKVNTRNEKWEIILTQHPTDLPNNILLAANKIRDTLLPSPDILFLDKPINIVAPDDLPILQQCIIRWEIYESIKNIYK